MLALFIVSGRSTVKLSGKINKPIRRGHPANFMITLKWLTNYRLSDTNCRWARDNARARAREHRSLQMFHNDVKCFKSLQDFASISFKPSCASTKVQFTAAVCYATQREVSFTLKRTAPHTIVRLSLSLSLIVRVCVALETARIFCTTLPE